MILNAEEIKSSINIIDVLSHFGVKLNSRKAAKCPFHHGTDLNFTVKGDIAACWSQCGGKTWDNVAVAMDLGRMEYYDALIYMAKVSGISVQYDDSVDMDQHRAQMEADSKTREAIRLLNSRYTDFLTSSNNFEASGDQYIVAGRHLSPATIETFRIASYREIPGDFSDHNLLIQAGILKEGEYGTYPAFKDRTIFPISDHMGTIVGFTARTQKDGGKSPKYVNSPETLLYHKSKVLYGLHQHARAIHDAGYAILVEGQMDVIMLHQYGICNAVAGSGTALSMDQARLLARYTDKVIVLYDGDDAGQKATSANVPALLRAGLSVKIATLPIGEDPDSYVRSKGMEDTLDLIEAKSVDAVQRAILQRWDKNDPFAVEAAMNEAVKILGCIPSEIVRDTYLAGLKGKGMPGADFVKSVKSQLRTTQDQPDRTRHLSADQKADIIRFGLYEDENKYRICSDTRTGLGFEISNFIIKPILLIVGSERSQRIVEVRNEHGHNFISSISSDDFVELVSFKKQMERRGNFIYKGKPENFINIKEKVYLQTPEAYPIYTLGLHKTGSYVWANGITDALGKFHSVDEYGIVQIEGIKYFLPAFSKIYKNIMSDDQENSFDTDREFVYKEGNCPDILTWTTYIKEVFGDPGMMSMAWYMAALFRDIIYQRFHFFPHLNLFGPPRSGKSFMGWAISSMFGYAKKPFHLMQGTNVGFYRRAAQTRNAVAWYDEYSNDIDVRRVEALKSGYDGVGHEKGVMSSDNRTVTTSINSAFIISGQHQPTKDVALFTRCITLSFSVRDFTDEENAKASQLTQLQESAVLSQITSRLHRYRHMIDIRWDRANDKVQSDLKRLVPDIDARMLANYSIPLTAFSLLSEHEPMAWSYDDLLAWSISNMSLQHSAIQHDDELQVWWRIFTYAMAEGELQHNQDMIVERVSSVTVKNPDGRTQKTIEWDRPHKLIFVRFVKSFPKYQEMHKRQYNKVGLSIGSLQHYLRHSKAYIGEIKAKRFGTSGTKSAWIFDVDELGLEIDTTADATHPYGVPVTASDVEDIPSEEGNLPF